MPTCKTCIYFAPMKPGHAAICFERWRHLPWNAAVPLTTENDTCEKYQEAGEHRDDDFDSPFDFETDPLRERS